jgi:nitrogen fixation NifU-like protein
MTAVAELYRALVLDHGKRPRNVGSLPGASHAAEGDNPLCGDGVRVEVIVTADGVLAALRFSGESCVLATASASLMTERLAGTPLEAARRAITALEAWCAAGRPPVGGDAATLGETVRAFADVHRHPMRVECATLAWRTLGRALGD